MDATAGMGTTTVQVDDATADALHDLKERGDSYDDVVRRLLDNAGHSVEGESD